MTQATKDGYITTLTALVAANGKHDDDTVSRPIATVADVLIDLLNITTATP